VSKKIRGPRGLSVRSWPTFQPQDNDVTVRFVCRICGQEGHPTAACSTPSALNLTTAPAEVRAAHARAVRRWQIATEKSGTNE
jgi:hypothetical protein